MGVPGHVTYGSGSIHRMRGRWQLVVPAVSADGAVRRVTRMTDIRADGGRNRAAARRELEEWRDALVAEQAVSEARASWAAEVAELAAPGVAPAPSPALLGDFGEYALAWARSDRVGAGGEPVERSTKAGYESLLKSDVIPYMAGRSVAGVTRADVEGMMASLTSERHLSNSTVRKAFNTLSAVMRHAQEADGLATNPCEGMRAPRKNPPRRNSLTADASDRLAAALAGMAATPAVAAARLALSCGLCRGELCALTVADCDLGLGVIRVDKAVGGDRGHDYLKSTKTPARTRAIPMNGEVRSAVADRLAALEADCAAAGTPLRPSLWLLGDPHGNRLPKDRLTREWGTLARQLGARGMAGRPLTLHDLRHTFATVALYRGADVKDVQSVLGHSSADMTMNVYAQSDPDRVADSMRRVSRL